MAPSPWPASPSAPFFARFWRESADRLFVCLAAAFWIFAVNYAVLGMLPLADERRAYAFALRLVGFRGDSDRRRVEGPRTGRAPWSVIGCRRPWRGARHGVRRFAPRAVGGESSGCCRA